MSLMDRLCDWLDDYLVQRALAVAGIAAFFALYTYVASPWAALGAATVIAGWLLGRLR